MLYASCFYLHLGMRMEDYSFAWYWIHQLRITGGQCSMSLTNVSDSVTSAKILKCWFAYYSWSWNQIVVKLFHSRLAHRNGFGAESPEKKNMCDSALRCLCHRPLQHKPIGRWVAEFQWCDLWQIIWALAMHPQLWMFSLPSRRRQAEMFMAFCDFVA